MNELLLEAARNTPVIAKPDVLVVGGGAAGLGLMGWTARRRKQQVA